MEIHNRSMYNAEEKQSVCRREKLPYCVEEKKPYLGYYGNTKDLLHMLIIVWKSSQT